MEYCRFFLKEEQIKHLQRKYKDVPVVKKALATKKQDLFKMPEDDFLQLWDWFIGRTVLTLENDEPTEETYLFEGIVDFLSAQDQAPEKYNPMYDEIDKQ